ncbi:MAG: ABC transporter permease [bacterium]|nr:ABC transporter permease [bacterium]
MFERIRHMLIKEFIQVLRDPRMRVFIFFMPIIQTLALSYAVTTDVKHITTAIYDLDCTPASRQVIANFKSSEYFDLVGYIGREEEVRELLDRGRVQTVIRLNKGFESDLLAGKVAQIQLIVDGTDSNAAGIILNYASKLIGQLSQQAMIRRTQVLLANQPKREFNQVDLETRAWFNDNLESRNFYVPGIIAIVITLVSLLLTSMAVVREREIGTIEQIMVTPITQIEFILGKTVPFALICLVDVILITLVAVFWFGVPIRGSLWLLFVATGLYLLTTLGVGLFISTISYTQQQALMSTFFFFFPSMLLSGFVFPIANMPVAVQWLTRLNPMRYFLVIIRGIFLKGVGWRILWPQMATLALMGVSILGLASRRFKKTLA